MLGAVGGGVFAGLHGAREYETVPRLITGVVCQWLGGVTCYVAVAPQASERVTVAFLSMALSLCTGIDKKC